MGKLVSDEEIERLTGIAPGDWEYDWSQQLISLVRKRLAERLRGCEYGTEDPASHARGCEISREQAARIVESD